MQKHFTFKNIFILSILFRIIAVVFAKGYAFSDDHFEVIEVANKWLLGQSLAPNGEVYIFNLFYIIFHSAILWLCNAVHITNPDTQMFVVRLVHAAISLLSILYGYKIAQLLWRKTNTTSSNFYINKAPEIVALLLGVFWLFPFMSVRSLREFVCIPFLLIGFYYLLRSWYNNTEKFVSKPLAIGAFFLTIAFIIRLQTMFFPFGVGLAFLLNKQWKKAIGFALLFLLFLSATQFLFDYLYWGNPLASLLAYVQYNAENYKDYPNAAWYLYIFTILGVFIFPASLLFIAGYFKNIKQNLLLFLPSFLFLFFHSCFPNKQERFILSVLPFIIILGVIGFVKIYQANDHKIWLRQFTKFCILWFGVINVIGLLAVTFTYSKRARVESMLYLRSRTNAQNFIIESERELEMAPTFYLGKQVKYGEIDATTQLDTFKQNVIKNCGTAPNYIIFLGADNLENRIKKIKTIYPAITLEKTITPSFVDNVAFYLNPKHNVNESWYIYSINN